MNRRVVVAGVLLIATITVALLWFREMKQAPTQPVDQSNPENRSGHVGRRVLYWYDPMMPQQRFDKPGKSPFMDMQLIPKYADDASEAGVAVAPTIQQNLGMRLAPVGRSSFGSRINSVGRLEANERALHTVPTRVSGYVERLLVRAVGDPVKNGELIAQIYSPDLLSAQQEFLALRNAANLSDGSELTAGARERLRFLGMAPSEIESLERRGEASARFGVYSPVNGFVMALSVREGGSVESGAALLSVADLSSLWLIADVPERDASAIQKGDEVRALLTAGLPTPIVGKVDAVYPTLNSESRTTRVRVIVSNEEGRLRPGMLANVDISTAKRESLSVPSEAVIYTGTRSIVIIQDGTTFRPAEVQLGAELGNRTEIVSGLKEGEQVVASGQFLVDSEAGLSGVLARLSLSQATTREAAPALITSRGEVVSIDHANARLTLAHEPISQLQWPAMTMPFRVADAQAMHSLATGDRVQFSLRPQPENGEYIIESIAKDSAR